jgi:Fe-S-cluster-containing dehydrogenase component/DMSO reductase anchor subunit
MADSEQTTATIDAQPAKPASDLLPILSNPGPPEKSFSLIEALLHEQQTLSAVDQFSREQQNGSATNAKFYEALLPAQPPGEGQQYAFEVDLDRCSGCKACVTACHAMNGLDENETWRDVGLLIGGTRLNPVMQHVTTACHHCLEPGCMSACPVDAYEKDPVTGIVKHLDDQCFGCQYCTLACPYDVPKYQASKGIVRKCDMCSDRLAVGEAPACVQACPHQAIRINLVDIQQVIEDAEADHFLPAAPDPQITLPTTHFKTSRVFPRNTLPADYYAVNPQHPHWPLIIMLVLTQMSVGAFIVGQVLELILDVSNVESFRRLHATSSLGFGLLALLASTLHLGRPQYAFRAFIGLRHSWLSREIVAFGLFAAAAVLFAIACWFVQVPWVLQVLSTTVATVGLVGVFCSVMIYVVTGREFWSFRATAAKFAMTSAELGISATWLSILIFELFNSSATMPLSQQAGAPLLPSLVIVSALKLTMEASLLRHLLSRRRSPLKRSAMLLVGPLSASTFGRFACGILGGIAMPLFILNDLKTVENHGTFLVISVAMLFVACLVGELLERYQFFAACASARMPGRLNT